MCRGNRTCKGFNKKLQRTLYYSTVLRSIMESYIICMICCAINLKFLDFNSDDYWVLANTILSIIAVTVFLLFPIISVIFMYRNWKDLDITNVKGKFGELYVGYNIEKKSMLIFWLANFIRRIILVVIVTTYQEQFWLQMMFLFNYSIFMIIIGGTTESRSTQSAKKMDLFNEFRLIMIMYHMILFTMFMSDLDMRLNVGYSCSGVIVLGICFNMSLLVIAPTKRIIKSCRIRKA